MIRSGGSRNDSRSPRDRTSPWTKTISASRKRRRFSSEPRRRRLSKAVTFSPKSARFRASASAQPTNPAPPVTRMCLYMLGFGFLLRAVIVAPRKTFLEPEVEHDEEVPAAHFLQLQFRNPALPVGPGDRDHGVGVTADDRLERHLHRQIEVRGNQRLHGLDHLAPVALKGVGNVVEPQAKQ